MDFFIPSEKIVVLWSIFVGLTGFKFPIPQKKNKNKYLPTINVDFFSKTETDVPILQLIHGSYLHKIWNK